MTKLFLNDIVNLQSCFVDTCEDVCLICVVSGIDSSLCGVTICAMLKVLDGFYDGFLCI